MVEHIDHGAEATGVRVGYARVSSSAQNIDRQVHKLTEAGCVKFFTDQASGGSADRPGLNRLLDYLREGDTLVISSMDRLARSVRDLYELVDTLNERGVSVIFLKEHQTYRTGEESSMARLMLGVLASVAEFERALIRERQADGIARAKERGVYKGRGAKLSPQDVNQARKRINDGVPKTVIARDLGVSRTTLYRHLK